MPAMDGVPSQREIIDRRVLNDRLTEIGRDDSLNVEQRRARFLDLTKTTLAAGRDEVRGRFDADGDGAAAGRANSFLFDQIIRVIYDFADWYAYPVSNLSSAEKMSVVAVGGYGRGELAPHSDIDLLFLLPYKLTPRAEQIVEFILYMLWDLGLKVGHATRSSDECIRLSKSDITIRTALLEARWIWGDDKLHAEFKRHFRADVVAGTGPAFIEAKLAERNLRHQKLGDSRYVVEPNIKEGKGGLRDLHTLFWIAKYLYGVDDVGELVPRGVFAKDEAAKFAKAQSFLWTLRCHLHYLTGRAEDRLTFDVQQEIGRRMGYTEHRGSRGVERFMKHYFLVAKDVGDLTRIFCAAIEAEQTRKPRWRTPFLRRRSVEDFSVEGDWLAASAADAFVTDPVRFVRIFHVAHRQGLEVHPGTLRMIRQNLRLVDATLRANPEANRLFMEILAAETDSEVTLRRMSEAGVLGRFVPDFGRVVAQTQHDMYHVYTVDEHTIFALGIVHRIEMGSLKDDHPLASDVIHKIQSRRVLYLAVMLHDIAKGRGGDHSVLGADIALKLGPRLGLSAEETETVSWLVRHHLAMSNTAFKRDIQDAQTIRTFVDLVQSLERLRLLLVLTVADIRAVGPAVWNNWKAALLRDLYYAAEDEMSGNYAAGKERIKAAQDALRAEVADWGDEEFTNHLALGYPAYWLSTDTATLGRHARLVREANRERRPLSIVTRVDGARAVTEVMIYTADHPGLFSRIAGALAVAGANIVDAKIHTLSNGMALDTFWVQDEDRGAFDRADRLAKLSTFIEQALSGRLRLIETLKNRRLTQSVTRVFAVPPRVFIDNAASATLTLIEVSGRDRSGLLFDVTRALTELGLQIMTAKISTYGERAVDVFYVKDVFGLKVEQETKLKQIRDGLLKALADPEGEPVVPTAAPVRRRGTTVGA